MRSPPLLVTYPLVVVTPLGRQIRQGEGSRDAVVEALRGFRAFGPPAEPNSRDQRFGGDAAPRSAGEAEPLVDRIASVGEAPLVVGGRAEELRALDPLFRRCLE